MLIARNTAMVTLMAYNNAFRVVTICAGTLSVRAVTNVVWVTQHYTELQFPGYYLKAF